MRKYETDRYQVYTSTKPDLFKATLLVLLVLIDYMAYISVVHIFQITSVINFS